MQETLEIAFGQFLQLSELLPVSLTCVQSG